MLELRYVLASNGESPFEKWFADLDKEAAAKVTVALVRLGQGNPSNVKSVGEGVQEYRINWGPGLSGLFWARRRRDRDPADRRHQKTAAKGYRASARFVGRLQTAPAHQIEEWKMAMTKSFKDLVQRRIAKDAAFAHALLREGIDTMLAGDVETGKTILRDYIKATVGFEKLGAATDTPPKSLIRMFGPRGNPQASNLFKVIGYLQKKAGVEFHVTPAPR